MKAYVVINSARHHDSSYWRVLGVFFSKENADACIKTDIENVNTFIDRGWYSNDFEELAKNPEDHLAVMCWDDFIVSEKGYYECWRVEEHEIEDSDPIELISEEATAYGRLQVQ